MVWTIKLGIPLLALIAAIALGLNETSALAILIRISILVGGIISCAVFNGFGEVIDLLEYNAEVQTEILECLKERDKKEQTSHEDGERTSEE